MFIFVIEQDIWVTRSNGLLKSRSIARGLSTSICNAFTVDYAGLQEQTKLAQNFMKVYNNKQQKYVASSYGASFTYIFNSSNYCYL
jgi:hypothetical protein